jgi:hypothetical protein
LAKASSVGAKTVNGPALFKVGTKPAAVSAAARVLNDPAPTAVSTMSAFKAGMERTGMRLATKAFDTTRVEAMRRVCIIFIATIGLWNFIGSVLQFFHFLEGK